MKINEVSEFLESLSDESRKKLINDHLVLERAQRLMLEGTIPRVLEQMHPLEIAALIKRIGPPPAPTGKAVWGWKESLTTADKIFSASCPACHQTAYFAIPRPQLLQRESKRVPGKFDDYWTTVSKGDVEKACAQLAWFHCGKLDKPDENFTAAFRADAMRFVQA
jgi:hypothetical protein